MQASASSPPFIFDPDMPGASLDPEVFEFFDSTQAASSPGLFPSESFTTESPSQYINLGTPNTANHKSPLPSKANLLDTQIQHNLTAPSTVSPGGSSGDSASERSGYKRKSSSDSSRSVLTSGDLMMVDEKMMGDDWKMDMDDMVGNDESSYEAYNDTIDPSSITGSYPFNDKTMENDFDFESAASSPLMFGNSNGHAEMKSPEMPVIRNTPGKGSPLMKKYKNHSKASSQHSVTQSMVGLTTSGSREASPLSAMVTSQHSSPAAYFNNSPSPSTGVGFLNGGSFNGLPINPNWTAGLENFNHPNLQQHFNGFRPPVPRMAQGQLPQNLANLKPILTIHPTPLKSRVETQIPIKFTLFPLPHGITKLHLPTHSIAKPKLLAKPTPERSPDTLELYTTLVCTSAMQDPEAKRRALERARSTKAISIKSSPDSSSDEEEQSKPMDGGNVKICSGCITRERKRAGRKKVKKVEEEESWHQYEAERVVVFNTHEIKEWQIPTSQPPSDTTGDRPEPFVPEGAMQVDAPMRIACYCRHQNEKLGFQVIFTIKDFQDRLIAQELSSSIMITDDHKTHNMPPTLASHDSSGSDTQLYDGNGAFPTEPSFAMANPAAMPPFRLSHSSSDLQSLQGNFSVQFQPPMSSGAPSQTTSATMTPRNLSRQASPLALQGPTAKKRKSSGSGIPSGLAMTRMEAAQIPGTEPSNPISATSSAAVSPFTPNLNSFPPPHEHFGQPSTTIPCIPQQYNTGPPTPNSNDQMFFSHANRSQSMENLAMHPLYSAPSSAHPSRVPSPNGLRSSVQAYHQQQQQAQQQVQMSQALASGMYGFGLPLNPQRPPTIHKLIPNEGPKAGGIEVTCLGSGFVQGLEVMFGDSKATTTTYWGETSLVCLLPPSAFSGTVPVTFNHQHHQQQPYQASIPKQQAFFKYVDDDEQQLIRTALSVLGHKMTGKVEDVRDLARRIVGTDGNQSWGASSGQSPPGTSNHQVHGFNAANFGVDVESTILKCLDLIDLDDSPHMPRFNLRRSSGQTMLHLACSLGLNRVVAALLARGANPEPRDKSGFTPMHFAALHNHPQIVRRLMLSGADPTIRSALGYTPSDMATSPEVLHAARRIEHHSRTRSGTSLKNRTSSATSLRSVWEPASVLPQIEKDLSDDSDDGNEYEDDDADANDAFWMRSRRSSAIKPTEDSTDENDPVVELPGIEAASGAGLPTAAVAAFREQLTAHFQHIQQTMHINFPNLPQMPRFDMANLPDYQAYIPAAPMVRRISNLVGNNRPDKEQDYRWWDLFSGTVPAAPPAYEEIFPQGDIDTKRSSAAQAAADIVADNKCAEIFDQVGTSTSTKKKPVLLSTVRIGQKHIITREQQDQLRLAHAEKVKRLSRDRNLFFIWIPLLVIVILAMLYNRVPQVWTKISQFLDTARIQRDQGRIVEVQ